jgi:hypothetical protein
MRISCQREHAQDAAHGSLAVIPMHALTQCADMRFGLFGAGQQLLSRQRRLLWVIFILDAVTPALFPHVLAQQVPGQRIEETNMRSIPLRPEDRDRAEVEGQRELRQAPLVSSRRHGLICTQMSRK